MKEKKIEAHLVKCVKARGGEVRKIKFIGHNGAPDRMILFPTEDIWFVELKAPGKKAEPHQVREHRRLKRAGAKIVVLDSIEKVDRFLDG